MPKDRPEHDSSHAAPKSNPYRLPLLILLIGYFPFLLVLILGSAWIGISLLSRNDVGLFSGSAGAVFLLAALHVLWGLRAFLHSHKDGDVFEFDFPSDWQGPLRKLVARVSRKCGLPMPDHLRLHATTIAHIYENRRGEAVLVIGGLALAALPEETLSGIIAHELAHVAGKDTRLSRASMRTHQVMAQLDWSFLGRPVHKLNPLAWLIRLYQGLYVAVLSAESRAREAQADAEFTALAGKMSAAATLTLISVLDEMHWTNMINVAKNHVNNHQPLNTLFSEQVKRLKASSPVDWEETLARCIREGTAWDDSHPGLGDRLRQIGVKPKKALVGARELLLADSSAAALFDNWPLLEALMTERIMTIVRAVTLQERDYYDTMAAIMRGL